MCSRSAGLVGKTGSFPSGGDTDWDWSRAPPGQVRRRGHHPNADSSRGARLSAHSPQGCLHLQAHLRSTPPGVRRAVCSHNMISRTPPPCPGPTLRARSACSSVYLLLLQPPLQSQVKSDPEGISYNAGRITPSLCGTRGGRIPCRDGGLCFSLGAWQHTHFFRTS